jgi:hypothetical protein
MANIPLSLEQRWPNLSSEQRARLAEYIQKKRAAGQVAPPRPATAPAPAPAQIANKAPIGTKPTERPLHPAAALSKEKPARNELANLNLKIAPSVKRELKRLALDRQTTITQLLLDGIQALKQQPAVAAK